MRSSFLPSILSSVDNDGSSTPAFIGQQSDVTVLRGPDDDFERDRCSFSSSCIRHFSFQTDTIEIIFRRGLTTPRCPVFRLAARVADGEAYGCNGLSFRPISFGRKQLRHLQDDYSRYIVQSDRVE